MNSTVKKYLASIGRKGGKASRRKLSHEDARNMVLVREAKRAYKEFYTSCFWSFDKEYNVTFRDLPWIIKQLRNHGGKRGWEKASKLCP